MQSEPPASIPSDLQIKPSDLPCEDDDDDEEDDDQQEAVQPVDRRCPLSSSSNSSPSNPIRITPDKLYQTLADALDFAFELMEEEEQLLEEQANTPAYFYQQGQAVDRRQKEEETTSRDNNSGLKRCWSNGR
jgi:hypothetical protein